MGRKLGVLLLVAVVLGLAQPAWADGEFYVIAGGGRAVGTAITPTTTLPYTISQPGFYYLTGNLTSTGNAIIMNASEVTLDLMGFNLAGPGSSGNANIGISINSGMNNVEVRNGSVKNFSTGIWGDEGSNRRLANLRVSDCAFGIDNKSYGTIITGCQASNNTSIGIRIQGGGAILEKNTAYNNTGAGFYLYFGGITINNVAYNNANAGFIFYGSLAQLVDRNSSSNNNPNWQNLDDCTKGLNTP